jgi:tetratricopeptide (TPR) repeat protein
MAEPSLGLIMILKNEEANLERSLAPVAARFDEVVAVDTGSTDATPHICRALGARVYEFEWNDDFAQARNFSISRAKADWLFWLDGDNAVTPADVADLRRRLPGWEPAVLWAREKVIPSGELLWQKRCFPRRPEVRFSGRVHEQLSHPAAWPQLASGVVVQHWGYADPEMVRQKGHYYQKLLEQMLEDNPRDFYAHFQMARCLVNQREFKGAEDHLRLMIADPEARAANRDLWAQGHYQLCQVLDRQGRGQEGMQLLDELIATQPELGLAHYHRGRLAYTRADWAQAARDLARAVELGPGPPLVDLDPAKVLFLAEYFRGLALERLGLISEAVTSLRAAVERQPFNAGARLELARLLLDQGRAEPARREIQYVLDADPANRRALRLMAQLELAA